MKIINQIDSLGITINDDYLEFLVQKFEESEHNRLPEKFGSGKIFSKPIIGVAQGNDPIFQKYKEIIGPEHLTPLEIWLATGKKYLPVSELAILSIVFPFDEKIRRKGKIGIKLKKMTLPSEIYTIARNYGNIFKREIIKDTIDYFRNKGYDAISGMFSDAYTIVMKGKFYTTWSERYMAFAAGLGTLGLHEGLITDLGANIRLASVITNAPLNITRRKSDEPYANCLYFAKGICKECAKTCPVGAITEKGFNKIKCNKYRMKVARKVIPMLDAKLKPESRRVNWKLKENTYIVGCELCQFGNQCTDKNPMKVEHLDF